MLLALAQWRIAVLPAGQHCAAILAMTDESDWRSGAGLTPSFAALGVGRNDDIRTTCWQIDDSIACTLTRIVLREDRR